MMTGDSQPLWSLPRYAVSLPHAVVAVVTEGVAAVAGRVAEALAVAPVGPRRRRSPHSP